MIRPALLLLALLAQFATPAVADPARAAGTQAARTEAAMAAARAAGDSHAPCAKAIGAAKAREVARYCRFVSGATHPPCNTTNACRLMVEHIAWACGRTAEDPVPCAAELTAADWARIPKVKVK